MKNFFSSDGPFFSFLSALAQLICANLLVLVCSLPVVTMGPALAAGYRTAERIAAGSCSSTVQTFFKALKGNFKKPLAAWLVTLCLPLLLTGHYVWISSLKSPALQAGLAVLLALILLLWGAFLAFFLSLTSRYENTLSQHLRNAGLLVITHPGQSLLLGLLSLLPAILFLLGGWDLMLLLTPFWLLLGFMAILFPGALLMRPIWEELSRQQDAQNRT